jgi:glycosidase
MRPAPSGTRPPDFAALPDRLRPRLRILYGSRAEECLDGIMRVCFQYDDLHQVRRPMMWDERDAVLITYADQVRAANRHPLAVLRDCFHAMELHHLFRVIHLLPFYPSTSDEGFSVVDYRQVDPEFGDWDDIVAIREQFDLMFDLVLNHTSCQSDWFQKYLRGVDPYTHFFIEGDPGDDLRRVFRPRTLPLLTPYETSRGQRHVWTTFSADQVDLNYREPSVIVEMLDCLLGYLRRGARIIRLDAVAFLWKEAGTTCLHLPQTHEVVKIFRDVVDTLAPGTLLLTETNVPSEENASYWGNSDETHLIYNFSLPPLVLDALLTGDGTYLRRWLAESSPPPPGTTLLNFTASHDGIGVCPLESLVPVERVAQLVSSVQKRGGLVSWRTGPDGRDIPYELNVTFFDALRDPEMPADEPRQLQRFMASQALMLSLRGIPAVYFHSLLGTPNDHDGVRRTGHPRSMNRRKFTWAELTSLLQPSTLMWQIREKYRQLLSIRMQQPAFHPDASQEVLDCANPSLVAFFRHRVTSKQGILVVANVGGLPQEFEWSRHAIVASGPELIAGTADAPRKGGVQLMPYQVIWQPVMAAQSAQSSS